MDEENVLEYTDALHNANIYLFLTSQRWLADRRLQKEVEVALERKHLVGADRVFVFPVQVKPCLWRNFSKLVEVEDACLPNAKQELLKFDPRDSGYQLIVEQLNKLMPVLRQTLIEDATLRGESTHAFYTLLPTPKEKAPKKGAIRLSLDDLKRWAIIAIIFFLIYTLYVVGCQDQPFRNEDLKSIHRAR
jgi:hypothetical protein